MKPFSLLEQIGPVPILPPLTPEEERELGERVAAGDKAAVEELMEEERGRLVASGKAAVEKLVEHNMLYAVKLTLRQYNRYGGDLDAIWSGALSGLERAAHKFDHTLGFRFITSADDWIREGIQRAIYTTGPPIHLPCYVRHMLARIARGDSPVTWTPNEREQRHHERVIAKALIVKRPFLRDHEDPGREGTIRDSAFRDIAVRDAEPEAALIRDETIERLMDEIDRLPDREREIILSRYGIGREREHAGPIAERYGITRSRVQQIEKSVLIQLREILDRQFQEKSA